jgi:photosystem II stability/assembly factor-like uncharacterized protein
MKHWAWSACVVIGAGLVAVSPLRADEAASAVKPVTKPPGAGIVVDIKPDRIVLMDIARAGNRLIAVGERGFTLASENAGKTWKARPTPVNRTLTGIAFKDDKVGVAVGHGGSVIRTEDGGDTWTHVPLEEAGSDSLLGVANLGGDHFVAYGAFGMYFDSTDAGKTWQKRMVVSEDFDRHISQVLQVGSTLVLVAESGTIARSDDGGTTWTSIATPYQGSYFGAVVTKGGALLVFGMRGNVYRTTDLGTTWQKVELPTTVSLMSGHLLPDGRVLLVGNSGLLAESRDDGQTLSLHWAPERRGFASLSEIGNDVVLVGETGATVFDPAWMKDTDRAAAR